MISWHHFDLTTPTSKEFWMLSRQVVLSDRFCQIQTRSISWPRLCSARELDRDMRWFECWTEKQNLSIQDDGSLLLLARPHKKRDVRLFLHTRPVSKRPVTVNITFSSVILLIQIKIATRMRIVTHVWKCRQLYSNLLKRIGTCPRMWRQPSTMSEWNSSIL